MDYLFMNGAIKALESKFLNESQMNLLALSKKDSFVKTLCDLNYGYTSHNQSFDDLIKQEEEKHLERLEFWLGSDHYFIKCFKFNYDLTNILIVIKAKINNSNYYTFSNYGNFSKVALENALYHQNYEHVYDDKELFIEINNIKSYDSIFELTNKVTSLVYHYVYKKYIYKKNKYLEKYFKIRISIDNIISILRCVRLNIDFKDVSNALIKDSYFDENELLEFLKGNLSNVKLKAPDSFKKVIQSININDININTDLTPIEDQFRDMLEDYLLQISFDDNSLGVVIHYCFQKKKEIDKIRNLYYIHKTNTN